MFETVLLNGAALGSYVFVAAEIAVAAYVGYKVIKKARKVIGNIKMRQKIKDGKLDMKQVDEQGRTLLMNAKTPKQVEMLLQQGIDVKARDANGKTALMYAAERGDKKSVQLLLKSSAEINAVDANGNSALHYAAAQGNTKTLESLVDAGANVNAQNNSGKTALMFVAGRNYFVAASQENAIDLLLNADADTALVDKSGKKAADCYNAENCDNGQKYLKKLSATKEDMLREKTKKTMSLQSKKSRQRTESIAKPAEQAAQSQQQPARKSGKTSIKANEGR